MAERPSILIIEDELALARTYEAYLAKAGHASVHVDTGTAALEVLGGRPPPVVLLDLRLPDMEGMEILQHIRRAQLPCAVIIMTAHGSIHTAVEAMRQGAFDFLVKPFNAERLLVTVRNALDKVRLESVVEALSDPAGSGSFEGFIGSAPVMQGVYRIIEAAATSRATVFITGESGVGKEVCAEAIHRRSPRREGPFVPVNCAAIPKDLMESELFGHVKGSFTGATADRDGAALLSDGGTLFLDEIGELDLNLQTKLLRFLQTGQVQRVGDSRTIRVDLRIICATNRDPLAEVEAGRFREDLYYRLHVVPIALPPLRERGEDVLLIAEALLARYAGEEGRRFRGFAPAAEAALMAHDWPGNVRQLQNVIRNIVVLHDGELVEPQMLPEPLGQGAPAGLPAIETAEAGSAAAFPIRPLWQVERDAIEAAIAAYEGNVTRAAAALEVAPSTLYRKRLSWEPASGTSPEASPSGAAPSEPNGSGGG